MKIALITGITGQDGSYLAELLLEKEYKVYGIMRRSSSFNTGRIDHMFDKLHLVYGDVSDPLSVTSIMAKIAKENQTGIIEIYNLGAMSHVKVSFETPYQTAQVCALGPLNFLEAVRQLDIVDRIRFYQASTSEMFGASPPPQNEKTPFYPRSPYGVAKMYAYWIIKNYREAYGVFACNGILFNHESPRRGGTFVTKKITEYVKTLDTNTAPLQLGNLDATRDWGHAKDYVRAMWLMLQQETPEDLVIATGHAITVREFVEKTFCVKGINVVWIDNTGYDAATNKVLIEQNEKYYRPTEVEYLCGDASKARRVLGWKPEISLDDMINEMLTK
jgi:GDPmannose 4,6-dehydratase